MFPKSISSETNSKLPVMFARRMMAVLEVTVRFSVHLAFFFLACNLIGRRNDSFQMMAGCSGIVLWLNNHLVPTLD